MRSPCSLHRILVPFCAQQQGTIMTKQLGLAFEEPAEVERQNFR
jgi:hypothetical protein